MIRQHDSFTAGAHSRLMPINIYVTLSESICLGNFLPHLEAEVITSALYNFQGRRES